ncbi:MAG TPA: MGMT family protein [Candidatus Paceibacterota bacterium]
MKSFDEKVLEAIKKIQKGKTLSYKEVASQVGNANAHRAVGNIASKNTDNNIPCHRVIRSDGKPGGYNGLLGKRKRAILLMEGVKL